MANTFTKIALAAAIGVAATASLAQPKLTFRRSTDQYPCNFVASIFSSFPWSVGVDETFRFYLPIA